LEETAAGKFGQDLYFRLARFIADLPPLRERREDIRLLIEHFLVVLSAEMGLPKPGVSESALALMEAYDYPGNIRELKNLIERALIESGGDEISPDHLHFVLEAHGSPADPEAARVQKSPSSTTATLDRRILDYVREHGSINNTQCRELLGVSIHRAWYLLRKLQRSGALVQNSSRRWAQYRLGESTFNQSPL
jgi:DNA-binding NtrC family response regulator